MPKLWVDKKLYSVEAEVRDYAEKLEAENERFKKGFPLYVILKNKGHFTPPEVLQQISEITGVEYKPGHLISAIVRELEQALKEA